MAEEKKLKMTEEASRKRALEFLNGLTAEGFTVHDTSILVGGILFFFLENLKEQFGIDAARAEFEILQQSIAVSIFDLSDEGMSAAFEKIAEIKKALNVEGASVIIRTGSDEDDDDFELPPNTTIN